MRFMRNKLAEYARGMGSLFVVAGVLSFWTPDVVAQLIGDNSRLQVLCLSLVEPVGPIAITLLLAKRFEPSRRRSLASLMLVCIWMTGGLTWSFMQWTGLLQPGGDWPS